jgi:hypothetical protein
MVKALQANARKPITDGQSQLHGDIFRATSLFTAGGVQRRAHAKCTYHILHYVVP